MNITNQKFKNILVKKTTKLKKELDEGATNYLRKKEALAVQKATSEIIGNNSLANVGIELIADKYYEEIKSEYFQIKQDDIKIYDEMMMLLDAYQKEPFFIYFDLVEKYLNKFNFTQEQCADVYAYFINMMLKTILNYKKENYIADLKNTAIESLGITPNFINNFLINKKIKMLDNNAIADKNEFRHLRNVISEDGDIIPFMHATDLNWIFKKHKTNISESITELVLNESVRRAYAIIDEEKKQKNEEEAKLQFIANKEQIFREALRNSEIATKEKRVAIQELKKYIIGDKPVCYIEDANIEYVTSLLRKAGLYTERQILRIKRSIRDNNAIIKKEEKEKLIEVAKNTLLSEPEREILVSAKEIIDILDSQTCIPLKGTIKDLYEQIINVLLMLIAVKDVNDVSNNDYAEYLILCIEDLTDAIERFNNSNYEALLILQKQKNLVNNN